MNETYIQTIRGGIQRVIHLAKDHWTQEPKRCGFNHHHELYGYIPVRKLSKPIREAKFSTTPYETFKQKSQMESHHTVAKAFVGADGFEYRAF